MKLSELTKELKEGKHVRKTSWIEGVTAALYGGFGFLRIFRNGDISIDYLSIGELFESDYWEVVSQKVKPTSPMNFADAMVELLINDKKIRRARWDKNVFLLKNKEGGIYVFKNTHRLTSINVIDNKDIFQKDWEIYEEDVEYFLRKM